jgi:hypothetical protein
LGDFYSTLGLADMWENEEQLEADRTVAKFLTAIFIFTAINLLVSIVLTITTGPGGIPDDTEWDMPSTNSEVSGSEAGEAQNAGNAQRAGAEALSQGSADAPRDSNLSNLINSRRASATKPAKRDEFTNAEI